jgi:hypothetical protein
MSTTAEALRAITTRYARTLTDIAGVGYGAAVKHDNGWSTMGGPPYGAEGVHVRSTCDEDGRRIITDLYVHGVHLTSETFRAISIPRTEAALNRPSAPDPGEGDDSDLTVAELRERGRIIATKEREERAAGVARGVLRRPDGSDPEGFYRTVAAAYGQYAEESHAPAKLIAEEAGVPVTTVHRWVREARRRGFLPPGRKGRTG